MSQLTLEEIYEKIGLRPSVAEQTERFWSLFKQRFFTSRVTRGGVSSATGIIQKYYYQTYTRDFLFSWDPVQGLTKQRTIEIKTVTRIPKNGKPPITRTDVLQDPEYPMLVLQSLKPEDYQSNPEDCPFFRRFSSTSFEILECLKTFPYAEDKYPMRPCPFYDKPKTPKICGPKTCKRWPECQWRNPAVVISDEGGALSNGT